MKFKESYKTRAEKASSIVKELEDIEKVLRALERTEVHLKANSVNCELGVYGEDCDYNLPKEMKDAFEKKILERQRFLEKELKRVMEDPEYVL